MKFHVAYMVDGEELYRCGKGIYHTFGGDNCGCFDCDAKIVRLKPTTENIQGRAYFEALHLLDEWAWGRGILGTPALTYEDIEEDIDIIITELQEWKLNLRFLKD